MKKIIIVTMLISIVIFSCKEEKKFTEPDYVLNKWAKSIETLNYKNYKNCEAYPKNTPVFREMYREYYLSNIVVTKIDDLDEEQVKEDYKGDPYIYRKVQFECIEVKRKTRKPVQRINGDVIFVKFKEGTRSNDGWLMANRTLLRVKM